MELYLYLKGEGREPDEQTQANWMKALSADLYDPFCCTPAWQLAFHRAFMPRRTLAVAAGEEHAIAFAETFLEDGYPCLTALESHWFSGTPLMGPRQMELFAIFVTRIVEGYKMHLPAFMLNGMPREKVERLKQAYRRYYDFRPVRKEEQRSASLEGGVDGWLSRRSGNFRAKLRKADRRAQERGIGFERHVPGSWLEADKLFARMLAVEEQSWKGQENSGIKEEQTRNFYHGMIRRLSEGPQAGDARVMFATHEGRDVGFIFGSLACNVYRGQQFSYAEDWSDASIGDLLQYRQLEWLCEEGVDRYDMGMSNDPRMAYKRHWAENVRSQDLWFLRPISGYRL